MRLDLIYSISSPRPAPSFDVSEPLVYLEWLLLLLLTYIVVVLLLILLTRYYRGWAVRGDARSETASWQISSLRRQLIQQQLQLGESEHQAPYKDKYDEARGLVRATLASLGQLQSREIPSLEALCDEPRAPVYVLPFLFQLTRWLIQIPRFEWYARTARASLDRLRAIRTEIQALGRQKKEQLQDLSDKLQKLEREIQQESRAQIDLTDVQQQLNSTRAELAQARVLLDAQEPLEARVEAAHPLLLHAEVTLAKIEEHLAHHRALQEQTHATLARLDEQLNLMDGEEGSGAAGQPCPGLQLQREQFRDKHRELGHGLTMRTLQELLPEARALEESVQAHRELFHQIGEHRQRAAQHQAQAAQRLKAAEPWWNQVAKQYELDRTDPLLRMVREELQKLALLVSSEDLQALAQGQSLKTQLDQLLDKIDSNRKSLEPLKREYEELLLDCDEKALSQSLREADDVGIRLRNCHMSYQQKGGLERLDATRRKVANGWVKIKNDGVRLRESQFRDAIDCLKDLKVQRTAIVTLTGQARNTLQQMQADKLSCDREVSSVEFRELLARCRGIAAEWNGAQVRLNPVETRSGQLLQQLQQNAPDYARIHSEASDLRQEVKRLVAEYETLVKTRRDELSRLGVQVNVVYQEVLTFCSQQPVESRVRFSLNETERWLEQAPPIEQLSLSQLEKRKTAGDSLCKTLEGHLQVLKQQEQHREEQAASLRDALDEANAELKRCEEDLRERLAWDRVRWWRIDLDELQQALEQVRTNLPPRSRTGERKMPIPQNLDELQRMVRETEFKAKRVYRDWCGKIDILKGDEAELDRAMRNCQQAAEGDSKRERDWTNMEGRLNSLVKQAHVASRYEYAERCLKEAVQDAHAFKQNVVSRKP